MVLNLVVLNLLLLKTTIVLSDLSAHIMVSWVIQSKNVTKSMVIHQAIAFHFILETPLVLLHLEITDLNLLHLILVYGFGFQLRLFSSHLDRLIKNSFSLRIIKSSFSLKILLLLMSRLMLLTIKSFLLSHMICKFRS